MNWDRVEGKWEQLKGDVKTAWGKLTDDDLKAVAGNRDRLAGKIHERYGILKEQAHKDIETWVAKVEKKLDLVGGPPKPS